MQHLHKKRIMSGRGVRELQNGKLFSQMKLVFFLSTNRTSAIKEYRKPIQLSESSETSSVYSSNNTLSLSHCYTLGVNTHFWSVVTREHKSSLQQFISHTEPQLVWHQHDVTDAGSLWSSSLLWTPNVAAINALSLPTFLSSFIT